MKKITQLIKKYWLFLFLGMVAASLLVLKLTIKPEVEPTQPESKPPAFKINPPQSKFSFSTGRQPNYQISLIERDFDFPNRLPVYQTKKFTPNEILKIYQPMIAQLGFSESAEKKQIKQELILLWRQKNQSLVIKTSSGQFSFSGQYLLEETGQILNSKSAAENLRQKLISWGLLNKQVKTKEIKGFKKTGLELSAVENLSQASVWLIIFKPDFQGYPLKGIGPAENLIEAKIDKEGKLLSLSFNLHQIKPKEIGQYPLKNYSETIQAIKNGQIQLIKVSDQKNNEEFLPTAEEIKTIKINQISLAYLETAESQDFYQPIFLFKGEIILKNNQIYQAEFILPAISSQWLKEPQSHFEF